MSAESAHPHIEQAFALDGDPERITSDDDDWVTTYDDDVGSDDGLPARDRRSGRAAPVG